MARTHGKDCRVYLDGRDASGDLSEINVKATADIHDVTNFNSGGCKEGSAGLIGWTATINGFHDPAVSGYGRQMEDLLGAACDCLSVYDGDADAIGDAGVLLGPGVVKTRDEPIAVADMIKLNGEIDGYGRAGLFAKLLHPLGEETITGTESSLDNTAATDYGGRANLHVTAVTGTWTIKVQHSTDDGVWADLVTFTAVPAAGGPTGESKEVSGTVNRYLRVSSTEDVAGSITFACGFARY